MERLDARIGYVWAAGAALSAAVLAVLAAVAARIGPFALPTVGVAAGVFAAAIVVGGAYAFLRYRVWRFELDEDTLYIERGVFTRVRTTVPFVRVQHVDTQRGPLERVVGLSTVVVYTAGSRGADVSIPGLDAARAADLQDRLRELAIESEPADAV